LLTENKDKIGLFIVIYDYAVILILILFSWVLHSAQINCIKQFKNETIEMDDFSIIIENIPKP
jgi:hypothetical protein